MMIVRYNNPPTPHPHTPKNSKIKPTFNDIVDLVDNSMKQFKTSV